MKEEPRFGELVGGKPRLLAICHAHSCATTRATVTPVTDEVQLDIFGWFQTDRKLGVRGRVGENVR